MPSKALCTYFCIMVMVSLCIMYLASVISCHSLRFKHNSKTQLTKINRNKIIFLENSERCNRNVLNIFHFGSLSLFEENIWTKHFLLIYNIINFYTWSFYLFAMFILLSLRSINRAYNSILGMERHLFNTMNRLAHWKLLKIYL